MENRKHLPVKLFQKRVSDERKTEGGGDSSDPRWVLPDDEIANRSIEFANVLQETLSIFNSRSAEFDFIPTVISLSIEDEAIAKSHRRAIKKLFNVNGKSNIIGFSSTHNLVVKVDSIKDAIDIKSNIENFSRNKIALSAISDICNFHPSVSVLDEQLQSAETSFKIGLINFYDTSLNNAIVASFEKYCTSESIKLKRLSYSPNLILFKTVEVDSSKLSKIKEFAALESFSLMPKFEILLEGDVVDESIPVKQPEFGVSYPIVGVLDSGISKIEHLTPWLTEESYSAIPEEEKDNSHGTFVSGVLLYGDHLEKQHFTGLNGCRLFDATVMPKGIIDEDDLIENVRDAIKRNKHIKIWNMSLGTRQAAGDDTFSDFGMALDSIQEEFNILICKSAGNCNNFQINRPISRIAKSADSIRSLVVGSIAHKKSLNDIAEINHRSPFSRIGYGPAGIIKPELVSYGGNAGIDNLGHIVVTGVNSFGPKGEIISAIGTSFSTPRVTSLIAALSHNINDEFDPCLLKALAIHSSKYPDGTLMTSKEKLKNLGFGFPAPIDDIIYNDPYEITLIQQDTLVRGEFFEILEFPFPENLIDADGFYYGEVKITLVGSPVLNEKQGNEYCQSNIDVFFGTYDKLKERDISKPNILNEIGLDGNENLIKRVHYSKQSQNDVSSTYATERMLLDYGKKFQPIKKWVVNLEEMTSTNKEKYLKSPKKWYLKVTGLYRDFSESLALADGEQLSQDFCLVITIRDKKNEKMVYDNVSQLLISRNFVHSDIKLREQIRAQI